MANYCSFNITITAEPSKIAEISKRLGNSGTLTIKDYDNTFDEAAPEDFDWGSKWIQYEVSTSTDETISMNGDTAWGPASGYWQRLSEKYSATVEMSYSEPGYDIAGETHWENGEETFDEKMTYWEYTYRRDNEYFWDEVASTSEGLSIEEVIETLGPLYEMLTEEEKQRVAEIQESSQINE